VKRLILVAGILAAVAGMGASSAAATNECRGLQVCVRVAGPWVVVPSALTSPRPRADFQLSCPRRYVIGGLDAEGRFRIGTEALPLGAALAELG